MVVQPQTPGHDYKRYYTFSLDVMSRLFKSNRCPKKAHPLNFVRQKLRNHFYSLDLESSLRLYGQILTLMDSMLEDSGTFKMLAPLGGFQVMLGMHSK